MKAYGEELPGAVCTVKLKMMNYKVNDKVRREREKVHSPKWVMNAVREGVEERQGDHWGKKVINWSLQFGGLPMEKLMNTMER